jgi:hypothetical protein
VLVADLVLDEHRVNAVFEQVGHIRAAEGEVLGHDTVVFAAGTQTESVKMQTQELFGTGEITTVTLVKRPERGSDVPVA